MVTQLMEVKSEEKLRQANSRAQVHYHYAMLSGIQWYLKPWDQMTSPRYSV